ncbi:hypothetical protein BG000_000953 [Podila horticola]|nr:hypothetical protein BG000_000953 [Podila horticola]
MEEAAALDPENTENTGEDIPLENLQAIADDQAAVASSADENLSALRHPPTPEEIKDTEHQGADAFFELLAPEVVAGRKVAHTLEQEKGEEDEDVTEAKEDKKQSKKDKKDKKAQKKGKKNNDKKSKKQEKNKNMALEKRQIPAVPAPHVAAQHPLEAPEVHTDGKKEAKDAVKESPDADQDVSDDPADFTIQAEGVHHKKTKKKNKVKEADIDFVEQEKMDTIFGLDDDIVPAAASGNDYDTFFNNDLGGTQEIGAMGGKKHNGNKAVAAVGAKEETKDDKNEGLKHKGKKDVEQDIKETKPKDVNNNNKPAQPQHGSTPKGGGPPERGAPAAPLGAAPAAGGGNGGGVTGYGTVPMFGPAQLDLGNAASSIGGSVVKSMFVTVAVVLFMLL